MKVYDTIIPAKGCHVAFSIKHYLFPAQGLFYFRSPALGWQSQCHEYTATKQNGVEGLKYQKEVGREERKEQQIGSKREIGKRRTGMNEVPDYMDACVRVWGKERRGSWPLNYTYLACVSNFRTICIYIILIVNLPPE